MIAIGGEYRKDIVDRESRLFGVEMAELERRRRGVDLHNAIVLCAEPNVAIAVAGDVIVEIECVVAYHGVHLPPFVQLVLIDIAYTLSGACPEGMGDGVFRNLAEDVEVIGGVWILVYFRVSDIARIVEAYHSIAPCTYP